MSLHVCPTRDIECGNSPSGWCANCPKAHGVVKPGLPMPEYKYQDAALHGGKSPPGFGACGPHMTMEQVLAENAALRQQLEEAQAAAQKADTLRSLAVSSSNEYRDLLLESSKQLATAQRRLADAQGQEAVGDVQKLQEGVGFNVLWLRPELMTDGAKLYLGPAAPASDERVKELVQIAKYLIDYGTWHRFRDGPEDPDARAIIGIRVPYEADLSCSAARFDAALAASKGDV